MMKTGSELSNAQDNLSSDFNDKQCLIQVHAAQSVENQEPEHKIYKGFHDKENLVKTNFDLGKN